MLDQKGMKETSEYGIRFMEELEGELTAVDIDGTRKTLKRLKVNESFETLGVQRLTNWPVNQHLY
jgi:hypothetical protein